jgi:hypothetical protein
MEAEFKNAVFSSFRALFKIVDGSINQKYYKISDGFLGLAPYTSDID